MPVYDTENRWLCIERSVWLPWGLLFMAVPIWIGWSDRATIPHWSDWYCGALLFFFVLGLIQLILGIVVSSGKIQGWCSSFSDFEGTLGLAILALPLHLVLKFFFKSDD